MCYWASLSIFWLSVISGVFGNISSQSIHIRRLLHSPDLFDLTLSKLFHTTHVLDFSDILPRSTISFRASAVRHSQKKWSIRASMLTGSNCHQHVGGLS